MYLRYVHPEGTKEAFSSGLASIGPRLARWVLTQGALGCVSSMHTPHHNVRKALELEAKCEAQCCPVAMLTY